MDEDFDEEMESERTVGKMMGRYNKKDSMRMHHMDMDEHFMGGRMHRGMDSFKRKEHMFMERDSDYIDKPTYKTKSEAEEAAKKELEKNQKKTEPKILIYGDFEEFDPFIETRSAETKSAETKSTRTRKTETTSFEVENPTLAYCRRCDKDIRMSCYLKHYVNHIYEKEFLIERWKLGYSSSMFEPYQVFLKKNRKGYAESYGAYLTQIFDPKNDGDYEVIFYLIQNSILDNDKIIQKEKVDEALKLMDAYKNGVKDKYGSIMLVDQFILRKFQPIDKLKEKCAQCKHSCKKDQLVVKLECCHYIHKECFDEIIMKGEIKECPKEDCGFK